MKASIEAHARTSHFKMTTSVNAITNSGNSSPVSVELAAVDIPGVDLNEPMASTSTVTTVQKHKSCNESKKANVNQPVRSTEREGEKEGG